MYVKIKEEFRTSARVQSTANNEDKITEVLFRFLTNLANTNYEFDKNGIKSEIKGELVEEFMTSDFKEQLVEGIMTSGFKEELGEGIMTCGFKEELVETIMTPDLKEELIERLSIQWGNQTGMSTTTTLPTCNNQAASDSEQQGHENYETEIVQDEVRYNKFVPRSCYEITLYGMGESGEYEIDPDGPEGEGKPLLVFCDLARKSAIIRPQNVTESRIENHSQGGFYVATVPRLDFGNYNAHLEQISSLAKQSSICKQELVFSCTAAPLFHDLSLTTWLYKDDTNQSMLQDNISCKCGNRCFCRPQPA